MVLFAGLGLVAQAWLGLQSGVLFGLLAGFVVANLVPPRGGGCRVTFDEPPAESQEPMPSKSKEEEPTARL